MPKISIIIPVYNTEKYLRECLDSVINQTLKDIEIICVDDGSTDNSLNILKEYALKDNRIKILNQKNLHAGVARNNGIKLATGEWIHFLDSDDWIDLNTYEKLYNIANNQKAQVIKFKSYCYDDKNKCLQYSDYEEMSSITNERFNDYINLDNDIDILQLVMDSPWSGLYRTNFLKENLIYFDNLLCANDTSFYYRCLVNARTIFLSSEHFVYYRRNIDTSLVSIRPQNFNCQIEQFYIIKNLIRNEKPIIQEKIRKLLIKALLRRTNEYLANNKISIEIKNKIKTEVTTFCKNEHIQFSIPKSNNKTHKVITIFGIKISIKNKKYIKINKQIAKAKYIHIMFNDKFNKPFVDFLNKNFNKDEHLVLCKRFFKEHPFPVGDNVIEIDSLQYLKFNNVDKIICHSLFDRELVKYLYEHKSVLKEKAYWIIWGGDLYNAPRDKVNDYVRSNFKGYINKIDEKACREKYKNISSNATFVAGSYIFPINKKILDNTKKLEKDYVQIQVNNSCDKSTLRILDILAKFKNENIKITTVLSYGKLEYKDEIIKKGTEIFDDKFSYIENYLSPQDYAQHLAQNDILILNQNRQQAVGNIRASLYLGTKIFVRSDVSTYKNFNELGCKLFDTKNISRISFMDFIEYKIAENNKKNVSQFFNENYLKNVWRKIFMESENKNDK